LITSRALHTLVTHLPLIILVTPAALLRDVASLAKVVAVLRKGNRKDKQAAQVLQDLHTVSSQPHSP
jgi:hypothetical protein